MDARSIAVQAAISKYLRSQKVALVRDKRGNRFFANDKNGDAQDIFLRELATYVADRMKPE